jgi:general secretion pathway protein A
MYLEHFGLAEYPFSTAPDPRFYYPSAKHREALACLLYAIEQKKGFALITGEVGSGKSMVCRAALERMGESVDAAIITHTALPAKEFLRAVANEYHLPVSGRTKVELLQALKDLLVDSRRRGRTAVLIVDEAQDLSAPGLEEVRLLGNLETSTEKLLQTILVGQPELRRLIGTYELRQLDQRITVKFHLGALASDDTDAYIEHRLRVAGKSKPGLFDRAAKAQVFRASGGIPRLINILCDQALLQAYVKDEQTVTAETVRRVISEREGYYMDRNAQVVEGEITAHWSRGNLLVRKASLRCSQCRAIVGVYEDEVGQSGVCPGCGAIIKIPLDAFGRPEAQAEAEPAGAE